MWLLPLLAPVSTVGNSCLVVVADQGAPHATFLEHHTTDIDSTVAMVIDMLMLINEPPEKLKNPTLEKHHCSTVTVLRPFFPMYSSAGLCLYI